MERGRQGRHGRIAVKADGRINGKVIDRGQEKRPWQERNETGR
jgi:hypothetical protein